MGCFFHIINRSGLNRVCVVCVFFPFILDIKFVGRTSRRGHTGERSHRISHPPSFCGACLNFSREKDSAIPVGSFGTFLEKLVFMPKFSVCGIELTSQRVRGLRGTSELPGRPSNIRGCQSGTRGLLDVDEGNIEISSHVFSSYLFWTNLKVAMIVWMYI